jgi:hypothetical protein
VRYVLVDSAVVEGKKPAAYFSRGEGGAFYSALAVEELDSNPTNRGLKSQSSTSAAGLSEEEELARDVAAREDERNGRVNARGGSPGFP